MVRFMSYAIVNNAALVVRAPAVVVLVGFGLHYAPVNIGSLVAFMLLRYAIASGFLWRPGEPQQLAPALSEVEGRA
jgi:hypothetical protein